jgi:hypothetical protein
MFSAAAFADTSTIKESNNQIGVQLISTKVDYTETGNGVLGAAGSTLDTETGHVPGYGVSISLMRDFSWTNNTGTQNDYFEAEYDHSSGNTNYTGAAIGGGAFGSVVSTSSATLANFNIRYGKGFVVNDKFMLTPYGEFGRNSWDRGVNYGENYSNSYLGIGTLGQFSPNSKWVITGKGMIGRTTGSVITVNSGPGLNGFGADLGSSTLYKVGASADYALTQKIHGNFALDYTNFKYGSSALYPVFPIGGGLYRAGGEPDSTTAYTTIRIGLGYAF